MSQTAPIQEIGYTIIAAVAHDAAFKDAYPSASTRFTRYRNLLFQAISVVQESNDDRIFEVIKDRARVDTKYSNGLISIVHRILTTVPTAFTNTLV